MEIGISDPDRNSLLGNGTADIFHGDNNTGIPGSGVRAEAL